MMRRVIMSAGLLAVTVSLACAAADTPDTMGSAAPDQAVPAGTAMGGVQVFTVNYATPPVQLVREDGRQVSLQQELDDGRPVIMNFIFTTCETTCPLSSQTFAAFQRKLGPERSKVHMVSISIDPEQDTPARLRAYAKKFGAGPQWQHYTGTLQASVAAQRAFGAYRGDKMSHTPLTLLRAGPGQPWTRIDGFVTPDQLLQNLHQLLAAR
jgi:protein SCO1/2